VPITKPTMDIKVPSLDVLLGVVKCVTCKYFDGKFCDWNFSCPSCNGTVYYYGGTLSTCIGDCPVVEGRCSKYARD
jgi:hypothetical protein